MPDSISLIIFIIGNGSCKRSFWIEKEFYKKEIDMSYVIDELTQSAIFYEESSKSCKKMEQKDESETCDHLAKEYRKAISILEKAENNTGS